MICEKYFWKSIWSSIEAYCTACEPFVTREHPNNCNVAVQIFESVSLPFKRTGVNIVSLFPTSINDSKYILVFVNHLSKHAEVTAVPGQRQML